MCKVGKACVDCLPNKRQGCSNQPTQPLSTPPSDHQPPSQSTIATIASSITSYLDTDNVEGIQQQLVPARRSNLTPTTDLGTVLNHDTPALSDLPPFERSANPIFSWGALDHTSFTKMLDSAYDETVHWKKNCFKIPQGNAGKSFTNELARLFHAFALESVALKAATVLPLLVLQKPHRRSKPKDHIGCLERRLKLYGKTGTYWNWSESRTASPQSNHTRIGHNLHAHLQN